MYISDQELCENVVGHMCMSTCRSCSLWLIVLLVKVYCSIYLEVQPALHATAVVWEVQQSMDNFVTSPPPLLPFTCRR